MTTIVYRDGVLAADTRGYAGYSAPIGTKQKVRAIPDARCLVGVSSNAPGVPEAVMDWFEFRSEDDPLRLPDGTKFTLLAVYDDGTARYAYDSLRLTSPIEAPYFAIGSGTEYALGALAAGASAEEAVAIACGLDVWSALPVFSLRF